MDETTPTVENDTPQLPQTVRRVELDGREIYLLGTAHVSKQSVEDVRETIEQVQPDTVCVELCQARYTNLRDREQWKKTDVVKVVREGKAPLLLVSLIMSSFQKRIGKQLGVMPGAEMLEAIERGEEQGAEVVLADRDIQVTLKRTWANLRFRDKLKMLGQLVGALFVAEDIDEETIEALKEEEKLADVLELMATEFPQVKSVLIDERDTFLAQKIRSSPGQKVVAVLGAGHVPGILTQIHEERPLEPLQRIPEPTLFPTLVKWGVPLAVIGLLVYSFFTLGSEESMGSVYIWILINGTLSALGAALALGHPITIASAFLAAPLTSLNPMIAAGWVAGLVQAFVKRPTVEDLETLPEAIVSLKGFWLNPVSRILLVVALANLGSVLGTLISGSWIAARIFG